MFISSSLSSSSLQRKVLGGDVGARKSGLNVQAADRVFGFSAEDLNINSISISVNESNKIIDETDSFRSMLTGGGVDFEAVIRQIGVCSLSSICRLCLNLEADCFGIFLKLFIFNK